jgi:leader peptidase (prepilin peptidase)/N-methyltransferase
VDLRIASFVLAGAVLGLVADRLSVRWPPHRPRPELTEAEADGSLTTSASAPASTTPPTHSSPEPPPRGIDWRTPTIIVVGAVAFGALAAQRSDPRDLLILGLYFAALVVLMATDLDQRLLPDLITLPMIPIALVLVLLNIDPLLQGKELGLVSAVLAGLGAPAILIATNLALKGGLGVGDLKLAVSLGLMSGVTRFIVGFLIASAASSVLLVALLMTRRIGRRTAVPFGPVLIAGGMIAALIS